MTMDLSRISWPRSRAGEAMTALGAERYPQLRASIPEEGAPPEEATIFSQWIESAAARRGYEAEAVEAPLAELEKLLCSAAPVLIQIPSETESDGIRFLAVLSGSRRYVRVLGPDLGIHRLKKEEVCSLLRGNPADPAVENIDQLLDEDRVGGKRRNKARELLLQELFPLRRVRGWLLRPAGSTDFQVHARESRLHRFFLILVVAHLLQYILWILSWWFLGRGALRGELDPGWFLAWGLILLTIVPFRLLVTHAGGMLSIRAGALLKRRLLFGSLRIDREDVRHLGAGQLLGRVLESEVVEQMAVTGGFLAVTALIEFLLAAWVMAQGAGGWLQLLLLLTMLALAGWLSLGYVRRREGWTEIRLVLTNNLVESMVGHRTRIAQEGWEHLHEGEDRELDRYFEESRKLDGTAVLLQAFLSRGSLLKAQDLTFHHSGRVEPVLKGLDFHLEAGDRVLLEGPSGGGKSTFGMLLPGCNRPQSGLLLYRGLDLETVGSQGWRDRVVLSPPFYDNHAFMGTFAFNALLGRGWPPVKKDMEEADSVCRALGLGALLDRMSAGVQQVVGETGWQLSHGERSRLYISRALLQKAEVIILDESFASLDPETLRERCVLFWRRPRRSW